MSEFDVAAFKVETLDVIKFIAQFLKENSLVKSLETLQKESNVTLNSVESLESFKADVNDGKWERVLSQVSLMQLPSEKLTMIYEQIIFELLEARESELAKEILVTAEPLLLLRQKDSRRFFKLEHLCSGSDFDPNDIYEMGISKGKRRRDVAEALVGETDVLPSSRLLSLLGEAVRYQKARNLINCGKPHDIFCSAMGTLNQENEEKLPTKKSGQIIFALASHPEVAIFSPDGWSLVTGSYDGFLEVWNFEECKLRTDLDYQVNDDLMMHENAILCATFTQDGEYLATGSKDGMIKIWKFSSGVCTKKIRAHSMGITSLNFSREATQVLSTSFDGIVRLYGLQSGKVLKEFVGHSSFVNCALFGNDREHIVSGSSDGTVRFWDQRTSECTMTYVPGSVIGIAAKDLSVHTLQTMPDNPDHILVVTRSPYVFIISMQGKLMRSFSNGDKTDFLCATVSPKGKWIYCVGGDGIMYMFNSSTGQVEKFLKISDGEEVIGVAHNPKSNILCTIADHGQLRLWKP